MGYQRFSLTALIHRSDVLRGASTSASAEKGETVSHGEHRNITGGAARAAVFGISDGLVSNVSLILGVAGAHPSASFVRLAGLTGLVAGACSMSMGEYISMRAQSELLQREISIEENELAKRPESETRELALLYESRGVPWELAMEISRILMKDPKTALAVHAQEELGVSLDSIGSPWQAAISSFFSFALGALIPLIFWFFVSGTTAIFASIVSSAIASIAVGVGLAYFTRRSYISSALRQLLFSGVAAGITYVIGYLMGVSGVA